MSKEQTVKSKYPSRYSPGNYVTASQYIIEFICERQAAFERKELPIKFWDIPEWRDIFKKYLRKVNGLLKIYPERAILNVLKNNPVIWSPFTPKFKNLLDAEAKILAAQALAEKPVEYERKENPTFQQKKTTNNKLQALMDIDNG